MEGRTGLVDAGKAQDADGVEVGVPVKYRVAARPWTTNELGFAFSGPSVGRRSRCGCRVMSVSFDACDCIATSGGSLQARRRPLLIHMPLYAIDACGRNGTRVLVILFTMRPSEAPNPAGAERGRPRSVPPTRYLRLPPPQFGSGSEG
ncbi:hypothetical protein K438DRAFT_1992886 [Mycena galopus ATCC 62051]|nr:hypothetical protein K438DRAFT_1992886 [Mycena galopus ATCC 62051]